MLLRAQTELEIDTSFPRDRIVNTMYFNRSDLQQGGLDTMAGDIADVFLAGWYDTGALKLTCKLYDAEQPGEPLASVTRNPAASNFNSASPREVALCLSYYADTNSPRRRGRMYLSCGHIASLGKSPTTTLMQKALDLGGDLAGIGGLDVDWQVYSPTAQDSYNVTNTWVDNEWDTMRSRGLRATTRLLGSPGE